MNLALWLVERARNDPQAPAVALGTRVVFTYGDFVRRAGCLGRAMRERFRVEPGARIAIVAKNCPEYLEVLFGAWFIGAIAVPINAKLHGAEIGYILQQSGTQLCFATDEIASEIATHALADVTLIGIGGADYRRLVGGGGLAEPIALHTGAPAWLFYTSGTTGRPKGATLTHGNLAAMSYAYCSEVDPTRPGDAILHAAPMSHGSGLYAIPHVLRGALHIIPESDGFDADIALRTTAHWRRVSLFAAPTMLKRLTQASLDFDPSSLRTITSGGAPLYAADAIAALDRFGPRLAQIYGQGESPMTITRQSKNEIGDRAHPRWQERLVTVGQPFGCVEVAILDEQGRRSPVGETGEIACRGASVMTGYWKDDEATARSLKDGWLHTGDVGSFDDYGSLSLKDRSKDLIISGGANIYPREIEELLLQHPEVQEAAVIGRTDSEWGEVVVAYVVGKAAVEELEQLCLSRIARFKRPRDYVFVSSLPKNNYGKVLKRTLREMDHATSIKAQS